MPRGYLTLRVIDWNEKEPAGSKDMSLSGVFKKRYTSRIMNTTVSAVFTLLALHSATSYGTISNEPLATSSGAPPNIFFILDDSGSMDREYMPDDLDDDDGFENVWENGNDNYTKGQNAYDPWYYSSEVNKVYFDPTNDYPPPFKIDGSERFPDQEYNDAKENGYSGNDTDNLSNGFELTGWIIEGGGFYYEFDGSYENCSTYKKQDKCYTFHSVNNADEDTQQAFANWYAYYRTREFAARAGISNAFEAQLEDTTRLGWGAINSNYGVKDEGVRPYGDYAGDFRKWLYGKNANGGTPLRQALYEIGSYYETDEPWLTDPVNPDDAQKPMASCRQSFSILMTDGIQNGNLYDDGDADNADGSGGPSIAGVSGSSQSYEYEPRAPFKDNFYKTTLADVAMHFWKRDLRTDIDNEVPLPRVKKGRDKPFNPAFWQHMVTMSIGFGVNGNVTRDEARDAVYDETDVSWSDPGYDTGKIDDLLHAAINSRGDYVSAQNTSQFQAGLERLLAQAQAGTGSASAAAVSSAVRGPQSKSFTASYNGGDWTGSLVAKEVNSVSDGAVWRAKNKLRGAAGSRNLYTSKSDGSGVELAYNKLSGEQKNALDTKLDGSNGSFGSDRITWLQGDQTVNDQFRNYTNNPGSDDYKAYVLGDIVNSDPQIERKVNFGHSAFDASYVTYRGKSTYMERPDVIYVGANDGFLHAFDAETGEELFGYMPSSLLEPTAVDGYAPINELMNPEYEHRFFVDGTPTLMDAKLSVGDSEKWRTVVVGTMGVGGDQVFALDVTEPEAFDIGDDLLWEFSDPDLDRGVQKAQVGRLANGDWAAIFGSGHGASSGHLFVVNLETGSLIKKLDAGNAGVSTPVFTVDDGIVEYVYAGNMDGGLWRFDLSASKAKDWESSKVFQTESPKGDPQPITSAPVIADLPRTQGERVISFGTGSFFKNGDDDDISVQSMYGIIDEQGSTSDIQRKDLLVQEIIKDSDVADVEVEQVNGSTKKKDFTVRQVSENKLSDSDKGWVLDLDEVDGERVVSQPGFPSGLDRSRVRFSTLIPDTDICSSGTDGFLMDISLITGGRVNEPVLDLDRDGKGDHKDQSGVKGVLGGEGITRMRDEDGDTIIDEEGGPGARFTVPEGALGRRNWEQLK